MALANSTTDMSLKQAKESFVNPSQQRDKIAKREQYHEVENDTCRHAQTLPCQRGISATLLMHLGTEWVLGIIVTRFYCVFYLLDITIVNWVGTYLRKGDTKQIRHVAATLLPENNDFPYCNNVATTSFICWVLVWVLWIS